MLYATAGCRLFIAASSTTLPTGGWIEIGETEAFGLLGGSWETLDGTRVGSVLQDGTPARETLKGIYLPGSMQIILGNDPEDAGQALLWRAFRDRVGLYPFRLLWPDGAKDRQWLARVTALFEVYDAANAVMKLQADLLPASKIWRSEET